MFLKATWRSRYLAFQVGAFKGQLSLFALAQAGFVAQSLADAVGRRLQGTGYVGPCGVARPSGLLASDRTSLESQEAHNNRPLYPKVAQK